MKLIKHFEVWVMPSGSGMYDRLGFSASERATICDGFIYALDSMESVSQNAYKVEAIDAFRLVAIYEE